MPLRKHKDKLDALYGRYTRRRWVEPDPVQVLYAYDDPADREAAALVAACLAYGRVRHILRSVGDALRRMGDAPGRYLHHTPPARMRRDFAGFRHRFQTGADVAALLSGARRAVRTYGSLRRCFEAGLCRSDETMRPALAAFTAQLDPHRRCGHLLPDPTRGSACKRLHLMLRWLVRRDAVDPGGWEAVGAERLVVPLDTHMHRVATRLGATRRRAADARTAAEVTAAFRGVAPDDPVRYDFALTRLGIHPAAGEGGGNVEAELLRLVGRSEERSDHA